jgi:hypothetical protein
MERSGKGFLILKRVSVLDAISAIRCVNSKPLRARKKNPSSGSKPRKPMDKPNGILEKWNIGKPNYPIIPFTQYSIIPDLSIGGDHGSNNHQYTGCWGWRTRGYFSK